MRRLVNHWYIRVSFISCLVLLGNLGLADDTCVFTEGGNDGFFTFTAPVVPISRTTSSNRVFLGFFKPGGGNFWEGNVIKLAISDSNEIVDLSGSSAILPSGALNEDVEPYWETRDWADPAKGNYIFNADRNIYTYLGFSAELTESTNEFKWSNPGLTKAILGNPTDHTTAQIIDFVRGADADGQNRTVMTGDVVHSEPLVVHYNESLSVVYFGSNDGMLHAVKDSSLTFPAVDDGTEMWAFIPPDQLPRLKYLLEGDAHQYFVDASPKAYIKDVNGNGIIELDVDSDEDGDVDDDDKDRVILVCGERKGGTSYFALDVTNPQSPVFLWRINPYDDADAGTLELESATGTFAAGEVLTGNRGGSATVEVALTVNRLRYHSRTSNFVAGEVVTGATSGATGTIASIRDYAPDTIVVELGESWSEPEFGLVKTSDEEDDPGTPVFFIGGGYSSDNSAGKAVLVVGVFDGAVVRKFSDTTGMNYSIPSSVILVDGDSNGFVDKAYVGDLGGQMWRFGRFTDSEENPLGFPTSDENINNWRVERLFSAGCGEANCNNGADDNTNGVVDEWRQFFYPPSVTLENGYDLLFMGTGDREDPCNPISSDRIYAVKDSHNSGTLRESDLIDATDSQASLPDLNARDGWYIRLAEGERVLSESVVFLKTLYVTTYLPGVGGTLYELSYKTGGLLNRRIWQGSGILSKPVIVINETGQKLLVSTGIGNPTNESQSVGPGILVIEPAAPPSNFFYLWWREL